MTLRLWVELAALAVVIVLVALLTAPLLRPDVRRAQQADSSAARAVARVDTLAERVRVDTLRAVRTLHHYDSTRVTDTLIRVDSFTHEVTIYVPRAVADTAIHACTLARQTCGSALAAARVALDSLTVARDDWRRIATRRTWLACGPGVGIGTDVRAQLVLGCVVPLLSR